MGKQNNNFEYFKPQNGSSFVASDSDSDNNSDSKAMFKLPKRKVVRSRGASFNKRFDNVFMLFICLGKHI